MSQQYRRGVSYNEGRMRIIDEVMCEKNFIWRGDTENPPEHLRQALLSGGWVPIEELRGLLTKINDKLRKKREPCTLSERYKIVHEVCRSFDYHRMDHPSFDRKVLPEDYVKCDLEETVTPGSTIEGLGQHLAFERSLYRKDNNVALLAQVIWILPTKYLTVNDQLSIVPAGKERTETDWNDHGNSSMTSGGILENLSHIETVLSEMSADMPSGYREHIMSAIGSLSAITNQMRNEVSGRENDSAPASLNLTDHSTNETIPPNQ